MQRLRNVTYKNLSTVQSFYSEVNFFAGRQNRCVCKPRLGSSRVKSLKHQNKSNVKKEKLKHDQDTPPANVNLLTSLSLQYCYFFPVRELTSVSTVTTRLLQISIFSIKPWPKLLGFRLIQADVDSRKGKKQQYCRLKLLRKLTLVGGVFYLVVFYFFFFDVTFIQTLNTTSTQSRFFEDSRFTLKNNLNFTFTQGESQLC